MDGQPSRARRLYEQGRDIRRDARLLRRSIKAAAGEVDAFLREQMERRPYVSLATAASVGYIVGGGLTSPLTKLLLRTGSRLAMAIAAREMSVLLRSQDSKMAAHGAQQIDAGRSPS
jgi:hypothetical protein